MSDSITFISTDGKKYDAVERMKTLLSNWVAELDNQDGDHTRGIISKEAAIAYSDDSEIKGALEGQSDFFTISDEQIEMMAALIASEADKNNDGKLNTPEELEEFNSGLRIGMTALIEGAAKIR